MGLRQSQGPRQVKAGRLRRKGTRTLARVKSRRPSRGKGAELGLRTQNRRREGVALGAGGRCRKRKGRKATGEERVKMRPRDSRVSASVPAGACAHGTCRGLLIAGLRPRAEDSGGHGVEGGRGPGAAMGCRTDQVQGPARRPPCARPRGRSRRPRAPAPPRGGSARCADALPRPGGGPWADSGSLTTGATPRPADAPRALRAAPAPPPGRRVARGAPRPPGPGCTDAGATLPAAARRPRGGHARPEPKEEARYEVRQGRRCGAIGDVPWGLCLMPGFWASHSSRKTSDPTDRWGE